MIEEGLSLPAPALDDPRYLVEDIRTRLTILGDLCKRGTPITIQPMGSDICCPSLVLQVDIEGGIVLDGSTVDAVNACIGRAERLYCQAELDRVAIQFVIDGARVVSQGRRTVFAAGLPQRVFHHQRRELFRLKTPLEKSPICEMSLEIDSPPERLRIVDISQGGIGLQHTLPEKQLWMGQIVEQCRIELPDAALFPITLRVANERAVTRANGTQARRTGLSFVNLPSSAQNTISRYVFSVERQRNARRQTGG